MGQPIVVHIAMPLHSMFGVHYMAVAALFKTATGRFKSLGCPSLNSILTLNFNLQLCEAINSKDETGATHVAMLHGDIEPQAGWLDVLFDEMWASKADIISAVVPIKPIHGVPGSTSTGIGDTLPNGRPKTVKLSMHDVFSLPETFSIADTPWPDKVLLINTGCMLMPIDVAERFIKSGGFDCDNWIEEHEGRYIPNCLSEDWRMSYWAASHGLKTVATRKVQLSHWGIKAFGNAVPWGDPQLNQIQPMEAAA